MSKFTNDKNWLKGVKSIDSNNSKIKNSQAFLPYRKKRPNDIVTNKSGIEPKMGNL